MTILSATVVSRLIDHSHSIGHKMEVYTIRLQSGLYYLYRHFQVYVPRGRDDGGSLRACLRALFSVKV